jgi:hypothetical protein
MSDVIFVAVVIAFFAVAVAYVRGCARIVGDDDVVRVADADASAGDDDNLEVDAA